VTAEGNKHTCAPAGPGGVTHTASVSDRRRLCAQATPLTYTCSAPRASPTLPKLAPNTVTVESPDVRPWSGSHECTLRVRGEG